jgi:DNA-binding NarL/FixJ family response regulator
MFVSHLTSTINAIFMDAGKIRVVVADDHPTMREGLKLLLNNEHDIEVVGEAADGKEAVRVACELVPDVIVMDISMPQCNGLQATKRLRDSCPQVHVLTLTRHNDDGFLQELLRAGAGGYVLKRSSPEELLRAVRVVAAGGSYLDPAVAGKVIGGFVRERTKAGPAAMTQLSDREAEVLRLFAWGYSNKEIAGRVGISVKTVETHKANAMRKLDMRNRSDIVRYALLQGWLENT